MVELAPQLELHWLDPPDKWQLAPMDVHVWASNLNEAIKRDSSFELILAPDELERASRFYFERDRRRFIAGRGILRDILSSYLEMSPSQLLFSYSSRGKPYLSGAEATTPLHFNVTHSEDMLLVAVTNACAVGIDVERVRPIPELESIVTSYFSTREAADLMALPKGEQQRAFYNIWTRKEACLKATGDGFSGLTDQLAVSFQLDASEGPKIAATWNLIELASAPGYVAALAAQITGLTVCRWLWPFKQFAIRSSPENFRGLYSSRDLHAADNGFISKTPHAIPHQP